MRPRWAFRYLTRLGISMGSGLGGPLGGQDLALEDPHLHADGPIRRVRLGEAVVDVRPQRVQRHPPVAVPLAPRDLRAAEAARARDPDAVRAQTQGRRHRLLHGAAEGHPLLELEGDVLRHQLRVQLGMDHLLDVEVDLLLGPALDLVLELLHLGTLAADDDAGARREDGDAGPVGRALDVDLRDARVVERRLDEPADLHVLVEEVGVALGGEPPRAPGPRGPEPETDRMGLLPHDYLPAPARARGVSSESSMVRWLVRCLMKYARPIARGDTRLRPGPPSATALTTRRSSRLRT